jgi:hypothetical protein
MHHAYARLRGFLAEKARYLPRPRSSRQTSFPLMVMTKRSSTRLRAGLADWLPDDLNFRHLAYSFPSQLRHGLAN